MYLFGIKGTVWKEFIMVMKSGGCPHCGDKRFSKVKFADADNKKFRIDSPENIRSSWESLQKLKGTSHYSKEEFKQMEQKTVNAWKEHIAPEGPVLVE